MKEGMTRFEHHGEATVVEVCPVIGRLEEKVRWAKTEPDEQDDASVCVLYKVPGKRGTYAYTASPGNRSYLLIEVAGRVKWDSRTVIPCDTTGWKKNRATNPVQAPVLELAGNRSLFPALSPVNDLILRNVMTMLGLTWPFTADEFWAARYAFRMTPQMRRKTADQRAMMAAELVYVSERLTAFVAVSPN
jgi:hypothetical protein